MNYPELIVFDLDYTLWDCGGTWCDCLTPPFNQTAGGPSDRFGRVVTLYEDVQDILQFCEDREITMALASRTHEPAWARELIRMLGIDHLFSYQEIFPSSKISHFNNLHRDSGIPLRNMLFFDDEMRNIHEVGAMGVTAIFVNNGLNYSLFEKGLQEWKST